MSKKIIILITILAIASFFRLANLETTPPGLYPDEAVNANNAVEAMETGEYKLFYPENNGREGLFINIQALVFEYLPTNEPWSARVPSALFGIITVLGMYLLVRELFYKHEQREQIALLATFLLAISFWHINFSRIAFRAIMAPAFLVWSLYLFWFSLRQNLVAKKNSWLILAGVGGLIFGLGFHSYIAYRIMPLLILFIIPFFIKEKKFWQILAGFMVGAIIAGAPLGLYFLDNPADFLGRTSQISIFSSNSLLKDLGVNIIKTAGMFNITGDGNWRHNLADAPLLYWPVGIMFLIGIGYSLANLLKKENIFIWGWLALAILPVVISNEGMPHALRAILMIPPIFILAGVGGVWLYKKLEKLIDKKYRKIFIAFVIVFLLTMIGNTNDKYFTQWGESEHTQGAFSSDYVKIGEEINSIPVEMMKYVLVDSGGVIVRGVPMPAQTIMFVTDTFTEAKREEKNIFYVLPEDNIKVPEGAWQVRI